MVAPLRKDVHQLQRLPKRIRTSLAAGGITTIGQVVNRSEIELLRLHQVGGQSVRLIKEFLAHHGLKLKEPSGQGGA
jgi:DNA-directed RNA polymerase alpha subunit